MSNMKMPYSIIKDDHCRNICKCGCAYYSARDRDGWTTRSAGSYVNSELLKEQTLGDIWARERWGVSYGATYAAVTGVSWQEVEASGNG
jgi:hypothetical protein